MQPAAACNRLPLSVALPLQADFGMRPSEISAVFQIQVKKVDDFSTKVEDWEEEGEQRQMDESAHICGKLGFSWENLKLSFCGVWKLNSQLLITCRDCNHKSISQLVP